MTSKKIRQQFLDFFHSKGHHIEPSAPMIVKDDPTLMFINAGMNPFKEFFLGHSSPKYPRIVDTQKCLRVSGKHNDLEEVGRDTYHHTMFEMMGNWSFGNYFKKEAINWAWELLTEIYGIEKNILYVTIFEGNTEDGLLEDTEALDIWKNIIPPSQILKGSKNDNFWEMGDQGPCGPCSEIHVDIRPDEEKVKIPGKELVNTGHPQVIEIWNLVFMEYNRKADGSLDPLPAKHIDTGMGFERLCMVLQGKTSTYDTDVFTPLIREIEAITKSVYGQDEKQDIAIRVIADHVRAVSFAIADGQLPSNTGAGYVIRRILRRAIRYGFSFLKQEEAFIYLLIPTLCQQMGEAFPELLKQQQLIINVIREEEHSFLRTLEQGLVLLTQLALNSTDKVIDGIRAFELYDTYGFPIDLTELIAKERGFSLDREGFEKELSKQKDRSRAATSVSTSDWHMVNTHGEEGFIGYDTLESPVKITRYRKTINSKEGERYQLVFNITPFYPEGGGQVGDKGYLQAPNGDITYVLDTKKENNQIVHYVQSLPKQPEQTFHAVVDSLQRQRTAVNHSATHLLHQALRTILGPHVEQKGSMVHHSHLRFDFSHYAKLNDQELREVSDFVNARIREQLSLEEHRKVPIEDALAAGAMALFGEKYGDTVRTIRFGKSIELCGGTHVKNTGDIWHFVITSESAVAAGIRRIEAITSDTAKEYLMQQAEELNTIKHLLNNFNSPIQALTKLQEDNIQLKKQNEQLLKEKTKDLAQELISELKPINGFRFLAKKLAIESGAIRDLLFQIGSQSDDLFIVLGTEQDNKALLSCYISKPLVEGKGLNAGKIVRQLGLHIEGGGGGQAFFATAGGKYTAGLQAALTEAYEIALAAV